MEYDKLISPGAANMRPSGIRKFFDIAAEMDDVITLGVGEPDFDTPWQIRQAGIKSLEAGHTFYTSNSGMAPLRDEICTYMDRRFGLAYNPVTECLVTVGGSEAIDAAIRALVRSTSRITGGVKRFSLSSKISSARCTRVSVTSAGSSLSSSASA